MHARTVCSACTASCPCAFTSTQGAHIVLSRSKPCIPVPAVHHLFACGATVTGRASPSRPPRMRSSSPTQRSCVQTSTSRYWVLGPGFWSPSTPRMQLCSDFCCWFLRQFGLIRKTTACVYCMHSYKRNCCIQGNICAKKDKCPITVTWT